MRSLKALAAELRGAQAQTGALERELAACKGPLDAQGKQLAALKAAHSAVQAQASQSALDAQVPGLAHPLF